MTFPANPFSVMEMNLKKNPIIPTSQVFNFRLYVSSIALRKTKFTAFLKIYNLKAFLDNRNSKRY